MGHMKKRQGASFYKQQQSDEVFSLSRLLSMGNMFNEPIKLATTYPSGMPWHATSFTLVQMDLGKPAYKSGEGYAPRCTMKSCTARSMASVVTPGATRDPAKCNASAANRQLSRMRWIAAGDRTSGGGCRTGTLPVSTYGGRGMASGTASRGDTWCLVTTGRRPLGTVPNPRMDAPSQRPWSQAPRVLAAPRTHLPLTTRASILVGGRSRIRSPSSGKSQLGPQNAMVGASP